MRHTPRAEGGGIRGNAAKMMGVVKTEEDKHEGNDRQAKDEIEESRSSRN